MRLRRGESVIVTSTVKHGRISTSWTGVFTVLAYYRHINRLVVKGYEHTQMLDLDEVRVSPMPRIETRTPANRSWRS